MTFRLNSDRVLGRTGVQDRCQRSSNYRCSHSIEHSWSQLEAGTPSRYLVPTVEICLTSESEVGSSKRFAMWYLRRNSFSKTFCCHRHYWYVRSKPWCLGYEDLLVGVASFFCYITNWCLGVKGQPEFHEDDETGAIWSKRGMCQRNIFETNFVRDAQLHFCPLRRSWLERVWDWYDLWYARRGLKVPRQMSKTTTGFLSPMWNLWCLALSWDQRNDAL